MAEHLPTMGKAACPYSHTHSENGGPFRYCECGWVESKPMTLTTKDAEVLAEALAEHRLTTPVQCSCGWRETDSRQSCPRCGGKAFSRVGCPACDSSGSVRETHEAHVASGAVRREAEVRAEALRPIKALADEAMRRPIPGYISALQLRAALPEEGDR